MGMSMKNKMSKKHKREYDISRVAAAFILCKSFPPHQKWIDLGLEYGVVELVEGKYQLKIMEINRGCKCL